jgi:hypothetical protein
LAYSSSWTYGIPQATTTLSKAISFWIMEAIVAVARDTTDSCVATWWGLVRLDHGSNAISQHDNRILRTCCIGWKNHG